MTGAVPWWGWLLIAWAPASVLVVLAWAALLYGAGPRREPDPWDDIVRQARRRPPVPAPECPAATCEGCPDPEWCAWLRRELRQAESD